MCIFEVSPKKLLYLIEICNCNMSIKKKHAIIKCIYSRKMDYDRQELFLKLILTCSLCVPRLTAFVAKVEAREFIFIDDGIICHAMEWLVIRAQSQDDGSFSELSRVLNSQMTVSNNVTNKRGIPWKSTHA